MSLIRNRKSIRLKGYDYSKQGLYFITICCHNREHLFGEILNGTFLPGEAGIIAQQYWQQIPIINRHVILHEFVVMPNHLHGILELVGVQETEPIEPIETPKSQMAGLLIIYSEIIIYD